MKKNVLLLVGGIVIFVIAGFFLLLGNNMSNESSSTQEMQTAQDNSEQDNNKDEEFPSEEGPKLYIGNPEAKVVIQEFIDYKCPNCNTFHRTIKNQIEEEYGDSVVFEIHHTPFIGPDSGRAARGAYCSDIHGSVFEPYNDRVFAYMYDNYYEAQNFDSEFQDILTADILATIYAEAGGADRQMFLECIEDTDKINLYINADQLLAAENGLRGTPSFIIGDTSLVGPQQYSVFKALVEAEL